MPVPVSMSMPVSMPISVSRRSIRRGMKTSPCRGRSVVVFRILTPFAGPIASSVSSVSITASAIRRSVSIAAAIAIAVAVVVIAAIIVAVAVAVAAFVRLVRFLCLFDSLVVIEQPIVIVVVFPSTATATAHGIGIVIVVVVGIGVGSRCGRAIEHRRVEQRIRGLRQIREIGEEPARARQSGSRNDRWGNRGDYRIGKGRR
mmetsp:Transcript_4668/g.11312  ORF Transcript_4668/g.11312 Transcript_4668/m.11312 type:complete len:202 (+) Transcript_4668:1607-2212(+)